MWSKISASKRAIISIGLPGSGKSTFLKPLAERHGLGYVSSDSIREELTGDENDLSKDSEVWPLAYQRAKDHIQNGKGVVFDSTAANHKSRLDLIRHLRDSGADRVEAVYFNETPDTAKARNKGRTRVVPDHVIDRMHGFLQQNPPSLDDGLDNIVYMRSRKEDE